MAFPLLLLCSYFHGAFAHLAAAGPTLGDFPKIWFRFCKYRNWWSLLIAIVTWHANVIYCPTICNLNLAMLGQGLVGCCLYETCIAIVQCVWRIEIDIIRLQIYPKSKFRLKRCFTGHHTPSRAVGWEKVMLIWRIYIPLIYCIDFSGKCQWTFIFRNA